MNAICNSRRGWHSGNGTNRNDPTYSQWRYVGRLLPVSANGQHNNPTRQQSQKQNLYSFYYLYRLIKINWHNIEICVVFFFLRWRFDEKWLEGIKKRRKSINFMPLPLTLTSAANFKLQSDISTFTTPMVHWHEQRIIVPPSHLTINNTLFTLLINVRHHYN